MIAIGLDGTFEHKLSFSSRPSGFVQLQSCAFARVKYFCSLSMTKKYLHLNRTL